MSENDLTARVCRIIAEVFSLPEDRVTPQTTAADIEPWDSMGHLMLVLQIEQEFETQLEPEETERMDSAANVAQILREKGVAS